MGARWRSWWAFWNSSEHVRVGGGDANLFGRGCDRHAQGLRGPVRSGAGPAAERAAQRPCVRLRQCATQSAEAAVLGRQRAMGLREAVREGPLSLAGGGRES